MNDYIFDDAYYANYDYFVKNSVVVKRIIDPKTTPNEFVDFFKQHPEIFDEVNILLRKEKIEKIRNK